MRKDSNDARPLSRLGNSQLFISLLVPVMILLLLVGVNLILDVTLKAKNPDARSFFEIETVLNLYGDTVLKGNVISILNGASELVILAIGMALVTAASGGQDISVGAVAAIAGSVFIKVVRAGEVTWLSILFAFLMSAAVAMLCGAFNGALVAKFRIQPMIATLILFTSGRSIAYAINGNASPLLSDDLTRQIGSFISGVPIQTPILIAVLCMVVFSLVFRFTNLRLYSEAVGVNQKAARLNGLDPAAIKLLAYVVLGFCCAAAGFIATCRMQRLDHNAILGGIEMDAILAVAIGGNALSGGKFSITGSVIGAYTIELLTQTLLRMRVEPEAIKAYKAAFIILLMIVSSPAVQKSVRKLYDRLTKKAPAVAKEGV
ncbi:MAG: ABC transporter permease [Oscillospiraceae bacterium]|nr:ABC transporter permease [Oscillospiraceae bacterium]